PRQTGNGILNKAIRGTITPFEATKIVAVIWDYIPLHPFEEGRYDIQYTARLCDLEKIEYPTGISLVETTRVESPEEAIAAFNRYYDDGQEGIILKDMRMIWENKRSKYQMKFKGENELDVLCTDWIEGRGKYVGMLGAIRVQ